MTQHRNGTSPVISTPCWEHPRFRQVLREVRVGLRRLLEEMRGEQFAPVLMQVQRYLNERQQEDADPRGALNARHIEQPDAVMVLGGQFGLEDRELPYLWAAVAAATDPALASAIQHLGRLPVEGLVSQSVVRDLFPWDTPPVLSPCSQLLTRGLLVAEHHDSQAFTCYRVSEALLHWLLSGEYPFPAELLGIEPMQAYPALACWPVRDLLGKLREWVGDEQAQPNMRPTLLRVIGGSGSGRATFVAAVGQQLGYQVYRVRTGAWEVRSASELRERVLAVQTAAVLNSRLLVWCGPHAEAAAALGPGMLLQWLVEEPGRQFSSEEAYRLHGELPRLTQQERSITLPAPAAQDLLPLWLAHEPTLAAAPRERLLAFLEAMQPSPAELVEAGRLGLTAPEEIGYWLSGRRQPALGPLAEIRETPYTWDDLVLKSALRERLAEFQFEAATRQQFWRQPSYRRLYAHGRALLALFSGAPGTGKTMAAQVIAGELGMRLCCVNLASVVSKYIGETAKNLDQIFRACREGHSLLFFDEADALFGKRTEVKDAHDRYANIDTNYLLQAIEQYEGVAILATNKRQHLDEAFRRRVRYVLDFQSPDSEERARLWLRLIEQLEPQRLSALRSVVGALAEHLDLTGSQIKAAFLNAVFLCRRQQQELALDHLLAGVDRELSKDGNGLHERQREKIRRHVAH